MRTQRGLDRFVTFVDAVVAIAITLLVLPLVDVLGGTQAGRDLASVFTDEVGRFGTFFLSLALIARLWLAHHHIVEGVGAYDGAFLLANLTWSLTIVLVPFATEVAGSFPPEPLAVLVYTGTVTLSATCVAARPDCADRVVATSQPALHVEGPPRLRSWPDLSPSSAVLSSGPAEDGDRVDSGARTASGARRGPGRPRRSRA